MLNEEQKKRLYVIFYDMCMGHTGDLTWSEEDAFGMIDAFIDHAVRQAISPPEDRDNCPDCGRDKAHNVRDILVGACPKWYAIRDPDAEKDCKLKRGKKCDSRLFFSMKS